MGYLYRPWVNMIENYHLIFAISTISTALPFLAITVLIKNVKSRTDSTLWFLFFAMATTTEIILHSLSLQNMQSAWVFDVYTFLEFLLLTFIISNWQSNRTSVRLLRASIGVFALLFIFVRVVGIEGLETGTYNSITRPLAVLLLGLFALFTLQDLWRQDHENLTRNYRFWMLLAMVLYYSASLGLFAFMFTKSHELLVVLFKIHAVVNIMHNILFTIGVLRMREQEGGDVQTTAAT